MSSCWGTSERCAELVRDSARLCVLLGELIDILDSDHIRKCESIARIHGYELDAETSTKYGRTIARARMTIEEEA